jgi:hypothetical protein
MRQICFFLFLGAIAARADVPEVREPSCQFSKNMGHPDPTELLNDFLSRDFRGEFLTADSWLDTAELCPGHEMGAEASQVVKSFEIKHSLITEKRAEYEVAYESLGRFEQTKENGKPVFAFAPTASLQTRKFLLVKTGYGWRLKGVMFANGQHAAPKSILAFADKDPSDKKLRPEDRVLLEKVSK